MRSYWAVMLCVVAGCSCGTATSGTDGGTTPAPDAGETADAGISGDGGTGVDAGTTGAPDGGSTLGSATVTGSVNGVQVAAQDAVTTVDPSNPDDALVELTEVAGTCADEQSGIGRANHHSLRLVFRNIGGQGALPLVPGTYVVTTSATAQGMSVTVALAETDARCQVTGLASGDGGNVILTEASPQAGGTLRGTFTILFGTDTLSGSFDAPFCANARAGTTSCR